MKNNNISNYASIGILAVAITLGACLHTNDSHNKTSNKSIVLEETLNTSNIDIVAPTGFHLEENSKAVKNPEGLVDASFVPETGYHLEQYDYDNNLFYVIQNGYHNEHGYIVPDGCHLEGNVITKNIVISTPTGFHLEENSKIVKNPEGLVNASFIPEAGYHLEQYDYDNNLFYVIKDGYHNEHGYLIPDGYHLEENVIKKDIVEVGFSKTRKLK